jgi:tagatose 1,6-diphosphate aldolase
MSTIGVYRSLAQCSDATYNFAILALDHRDNLIADLQKHRATPVTADDVIAFKRSILRISDAATAVLIDPDYGLPSVAAGVVPGRVGLLAPLEVTDYRPHPSQRAPRLIPDWGPAPLRHAGINGAKLLLYYHPDASDAADKTALVERLVAECAAQGVPLFLEPIAYSLDPSTKLSSDEHRRVVVESARHFSRRGPAIMKMEFPVDVTAERDERVWTEALGELDAACATPWALLSAGVAYDIFLRQTELACQAGASGVIAGRAVWAEAVALDGAERDRFVDTVARRRFEQLAAISRALGRPWTRKIKAPDLPMRWYAPEPTIEPAV